MGGPAAVLSCSDKRNVRVGVTWDDERRNVATEISGVPACSGGEVVMMMILCIDFCFALWTVPLSLTLRKGRFTATSVETCALRKPV